MKRKLCLALALLMALSLALTACGKPPSGNADTTDGAGTTPATAPSTDADGGKAIFRYGFDGWWPDSKNPLTSGYAISTTAYHSNIYEGLMQQNQDLEIVGRLAEKWTVSEDNLTWTFNLRHNVKWHDGEDFTADDVVYTLNMAKEFGLSRHSGTLASFEKATKIDDYTVEIKTLVPMANIVDLGLIEIVPEHIWSKEVTKENAADYANEKPVGTGALKFVEDKMDEYVRYEANKEYWGGAPKIDELILVYFANADTKIQALEKGEIDLCNITSSQVEYAKGLQGVTLNQYTSVTLQELGFNCWNSPESKGNPIIRDNKVIRQAIDYAINYDQMIEYACGGLGEKVYGLIPKMTPWTWEPSAEQKREYSVEKGNKLLDDAGFKDTNNDGVRETPDGKPLHFRCAVIEGDYKDQAMIVQKNCKDIGVEIELMLMDSARQSEIMSTDNGVDADMYFWGWTGDYQDPNFMLSVMTTEEIGGASDCNWSNAEYDALYKEQMKTLDYDKRMELVHKMQALVYEEAPYLILYNSVKVQAYNSAKWTGFEQMPKGSGGVFNVFSVLHLEKIK